MCNYTNPFYDTKCYVKALWEFTTEHLEKELAYSENSFNCGNFTRNTKDNCACYILPLIDELYINNRSVYFGHTIVSDDKTVIESISFDEISAFIPKALSEIFG